MLLTPGSVTVPARLKCVAVVGRVPELYLYDPKGEQKICLAPRTTFADEFGFIY